MEFDARDPAHEIDGMPFDTLARIRAEQPICPSPKGGWYLSTRRHIDTALKEVETFVADLAPMAGLPGTEAVPFEELFLSEIPEPRHGRIRRLYNSNFAPHRLRNTEEFVTRTCHRLLDPMLAAGEGDLHAGYAMPIPSATLADLMGLPPEAGDKFMGWSFDGTLMQRPGTPGIKPTGPPILDYFRTALAERRAASAAGEEQPHDVIIGLMNAEIDGVPLSDTEIATQLQFMVMAGVHTTRALLVHLAHRLLRDRELFEQVSADRDLVVPLVEESLRHDAPVQATTRRCTHDISLDGVEMKAGEWVEVGIGSANRDETVYDDPDVFRLDRDDPRDHLGFGGGPHICPGATLARIEAICAVNVLCDRVAEMSVIEGATYPPLPGGMSHLPIPAKLTPRPG